MKTINIKATTLPDSWFQLISAILEHGRTFKIDQGSYAGQNRLELDYVTVHIEKPYLRDVEGWPLIPEIPESMNVPAPVTIEYVQEYWVKLMTAQKDENEQYTYGERIVTQIETIIERYKEHGHRNNQLVLQIARPSDLKLEDPPCLRHIDTRIQDNKLHFFIYFRSWDLWGGYPANLAGISILHEYMAAQIGVEQGEFICSSKGLHIYGYVEELAKIRCMKE